MTPEQKIIEACVKANHSIRQVKRKILKTYDNEHLDSERWYWGKVEFLRPINLEDVLVAIDKAGLEIAVECNGYFRERFEGYWEVMGNKKGGDVKWLLGKPLSEQPSETKEFIASLL